MFCSKCGKEIPEDASFCPFCGNKIGEQIEAPKSIVSETTEKVKEKEFVKSVKQDIGNSQSINMIKGKISGVTEKVKSAAPDTKKKWKTIAIVVLVVLGVVLLLTNIHKCDECESLYMGSENIISFWGESASVCKDCYKDFYSW